MKIIFMGTPEFAVPALSALIESEHKVAAVYTQPPRPAGRGQKLKKSPVHDLAEKHNIIIRTPTTLKNEETQKEFVETGADVAVVSAYGLILPKPILEACQYGCINIHPSLLPRWRGASPIQRALMTGDAETGVCIMKMDEGLDTGDVLACEKTSIGKNETTSELHDRLATEGAKLLLSTIAKLETIKPQKQSEEGATYAKKLSKEEGKINWNLPAQLVHAQIRGVTPWPGASFFYKGEQIKVLKASYIDDKENKEPGKVLDDKLSIACKSGILHPEILQRQGKKPIAAEEFLRGFSIPAGTILE